MAEKRKADDNGNAPSAKRLRSQLVKPREIVLQATPNENIDTLKIQGWSIPILPSNDQEAVSQHKSDTAGSSRIDPWAVSAERDFATRLKTQPKFQVDDYYNRNQRREIWMRCRSSSNAVLDDEVMGPLRKSAAAVTNALLNTVVVPPYGFSGPVRPLDDTHMSVQDKVEQGCSTSALGRYHALHDGKWGDYEEDQTPTSDGVGS